MFEVPGSDITNVLVEEDTARGYHPARYLYKDSSSAGRDDGEEAQSPDVVADLSSTDTSSEIKTSVL